MDRQKYVHNEDYRAGYSDGVREGQNTVYLNSLQKLISIVNELNKFKESFEKEYEEIKNKTNDDILITCEEKEQGKCPYYSG